MDKRRRYEWEQVNGQGDLMRILAETVDGRQWSLWDRSVWSDVRWHVLPATPALIAKAQELDYQQQEGKPVLRDAA